MALNEVTQAQLITPAHRPSIVCAGTCPHCHSLDVSSILTLIMLSVGMAVLAGRFEFGRNIVEQPVPAMIGLYLVAGLVYLLLVYRLVRGVGLLPLSLVIGAGAIMRLAMLMSGIGAETDIYRYLWDGTITKNGLNPYRYAPAQIMAALRETGDVPVELVDLARQSPLVLQRVNHPNLTTIYPTVAQAAFALASAIDPLGVFAWRLVLLAFDFATLLLLMNLLAMMHLPRSWLAIYWLNPLLIKECLNSGHMDLIALPFVLGSLLSALRRRSWLAGTLLALAVASKIWPIILLPIVLRSLPGPRRRVTAAAVFAVISTILWMPLFLAHLRADSGLVAYTRFWECNAPIFPILRRGFDAALGFLGVVSVSGHFIARVLLGLVTISWALWLCFRGNHLCRISLADQFLLTVAGFLLLSATQFPWYGVWIVPLLTLRPRWPLLLYVTLVPLFYLEPLFAAHPGGSTWAHAIIWIEHVPVWLAILMSVVPGPLRFDPLHLR